MAAVATLGIYAQGGQQPAQPAAGAGGANQDPWASGTFNELRLRAVGPALMSGRVNIVAVHPDDKQTWYVGVASGGVWKTTNAGITFTPVFQNEGSYSIGTVMIDRKNPEHGLGRQRRGQQPAQRRLGRRHLSQRRWRPQTWRNLGLKDSQHIGRIVIDPRDSKVVYVAAYGPLWSSGGDRGLYKTTDGGANWTKILNISEHTGISDVAMDPNNPDVLIATAHQRRRHTWTLIHGGPESGIHKSTDGGATWRRIRTGLPNGDLGRIVPAFSPAQKGLIYAKVETAENTAIYASNDSGDSWERRGNVQAQPMYYENIHPDPKVAEKLYVPIGADADLERRRPHVPRRRRAQQARRQPLVWIDPDNTDHLLEGCDGGLYETWDGGRLWRHFTNLSVTQFYNVDVDNASPIYNIYGGTQDNSTLGGPSRSQGAQGVDQQRLVHRHRRRRLRVAHRSHRSEHRLWRIAVRRRGASRSPHQRARQHPSGRGSRRVGATLQLGNAVHHQPAQPDASLLRRQPACSAATIAATRGSRSVPISRGRPIATRCR